MALTYNTWGPNHSNVSAPALSLTGANNSEEFIDLEGFENFSVQGVWAGVTGGPPVVTLQQSIDGVNWNDISGATLTTAGASGSAIQNLTIKSAKKIRGRVSTVGTAGTMTLTLNANGSNAPGRKKKHA